MSFIKVIQHDEAEGDLKQIYDNLVQSRGALAEVHKIQSLNPQTIVNHMDLYISIMFGRSPIKRAQREMIAVTVSVANNCDYCHHHHGAALNHFWKDEERLEAFKKDFRSAGLDQKEILLCEYAQMLTLEPGNSKAIEAKIDQMKVLGVSDREILDAAKPR